MREQREEILWDLHQETIEQGIVPSYITNEINPEEFGLEPVKAKEMTSGLSTTISERQALIDAYLDVVALEINSENLPIFKELRLKIVKNRTQGIEKWHKVNKAFYLAGGRFVDAIKNKEVLINEEMESKLMDAEKFFENLEKEKKAEINRNRLEKLSPYVADTFGMDLSDMSDYDFDDFLLGKKTRFEAEIEAQKQLEIEAEKLRLAEIERQRLAEIENEKIRVENARLKAEADKKELALKKERELAKAEADKIEAQNQAELKKEREAREILEAELKAKKDAELKLELDKKEAAEKLAKSGVEAQLTSWIESFNIEIPEHLKDNEIANEILLKFWSFKSWAKKEIK